MRKKIVWKKEKNIDDILRELCQSCDFCRRCEQNKQFCSRMDRAKSNIEILIKKALKKKTK